MSMSSEVMRVAVEQYGPLGILAIVLWYRQGRIIDAITLLAEETPGVDEDNVESQIRVRGDG